MARKTKPTNIHLKKLIRDLNKQATHEKIKLWKRIALDLGRASRQRREVNIQRINLHTKKDETVIVPGKVLSKGELDHSIKVAAWKFSERAREKINKVGKALSINDLLKENPKAKGVRIIG